MKKKLLLFDTSGKALIVKATKRIMDKEAEKRNIEIIIFPGIEGSLLGESDTYDMDWYFKNTTDEKVKEYHEWLEKAIYECDLMITLSPIEDNLELPTVLLKEILNTSRLYHRSLQDPGLLIQVLDYMIEK